MSTYTSQYFQNGEQLDQALMRAINAVSHAPQTLTDAQKAQARENIDAMSVDDKNLMVITVTDDGNGSYTSDKTFSEIYEFVNNGGFAVVRYGTGLYKQLTITPSACKFTQDIMLSSSLQHVVITIPASGAITRKASTIDKLKNPNAITFTGAVEATYDGSSPVTVEIPQGGSGGGIDVSGATVGQTIQVAAVDAEGKPAEWIPVDFPSGGGWELIADIVLEEDGDSATEMFLTKNHAGNSFKYTEIFVSVYGTVMEKVSSLVYPRAYPIGYINGVSRSFPHETYKNGTLKGGDSLNVWMRYGVFTTSFVQEGDGKTNNFHMGSSYADKIEGVKLTCNFTGADETNVLAYCPLAAGGRITIYGRK